MALHVVILMVYFTVVVTCVHTFVSRVEANGEMNANEGTWQDWRSYGPPVWFHWPELPTNLYTFISVRDIHANPTVISRTCYNAMSHLYHYTIKLYYPPGFVL